MRKFTAALFVVLALAAGTAHAGPRRAGSCAGGSCPATAVSSPQSPSCAACAPARTVPQAEHPRTRRDGPVARVLHRIFRR